jgi:hypothetical protein
MEYSKLLHTIKTGSDYTRDNLFQVMQKCLNKDPNAKLTETYFKAIVEETFLKVDEEFMVRIKRIPCNSKRKEGFDISSR